MPDSQLYRFFLSLTTRVILSFSLNSRVVSVEVLLEHSIPLEDSIEYRTRRMILELFRFVMIGKFALMF